MFQSQGAAPGIYVVRLHAPGDFPNEVGHAAAEIAREGLLDIIDARLVMRDGEGRVVEENHWLAVDHRPVAGREGREEIADVFVEPFAPRGGSQGMATAPTII